MKTDVTIIGGGLVGMTLACSLAQSDVSVTIIETQNPDDQNTDKFDGRCSAIAPSSVEIFKEIGIWNDLEQNAGPIKEIYVTDGNSPLFLHFGEQETHGNAMGYMIENRFTRRALFAKISESENITLLAPAKYKSIDYGAHLVTTILEDGSQIESKLLLAADGRFSKIREDAGIETTGHDYKQSGIVCAVTHEKPHNGVAQERFLPAGPFAILPMVNQNQSALVWTENNETAPKLAKMDEKEFNKELEKRFGDYLGKVELLGQRWCYPIVLTFAKKYTSKRMCLIGDACHAIHPVAGQGVNLSWRDVSVLSQLIIDAKNLGLDIGGDTTISQYQALRKKDNLLMIAATDILVRLFSNNSTSLRIIRKTGMSLINKIPALKQKFVGHAMGEK